MTLVEFLTARWDEKQAEADRMEHYGVGLDPPNRGCAALFLGEDECHCGMPERRAYALADLASKRSILALYVEADQWYTANKWAPAGEFHGLHKVVLLLAAPFAFHPDFDPSWSTG